MKLTLRGHHLLCLQGFQGYGYDAGFVENMTEINSLRQREDVKIAVCDHPDDICSACPNLMNGICTDEDENEEIVRMDRKVLEKLPKREFESSKDLFDLINRKFPSRESVKDICDNCRWMKECLFISEKNNSQNR